MSTIEINSSDGTAVQITDQGSNTINLTQPISSVVEVVTLGPQGPVGPQGLQGIPGSITSHTNLIVTGSIWASGSNGHITSSGNISSSGYIIASSFTGSLNGTSSFSISSSLATNALTASFLPVGTYNITSSWATNALTASYILNAISSSFATTSSYALNGGVTSIAAGSGISINQSTGNVTITNTGGGGGATFPYTGSAIISGSLIVTGSVTSTLGFTGSLLGTASRAVSSSYALTASYALSSAGGGGGTSLGSIFITLYDGGSNLTTGIKDTPAYIPYNGTATGWEMLAYNSSNVLMTASCVVDILQGRFATLPLSGSNSMAGSEKPTLTNQSSSFSSSLSTWTSITAGDYVQAEIESISGNVAKIVIAIKTTKF
jgi:hypothetical protein